MLRTVAFSRHTTALVAIAWLALGSSIALTSATFADDGTTTASPSAASTDGGSGGGAASSNTSDDGSGNSTAAVSSSNDSTASVDNTTAAAETTTQAAAATTQSTGDISHVTTPPPGPSVHQVQRSWNKNKWSGPNKKNKVKDGATTKTKTKPEIITTDNLPATTGTGQATAAGVKTKVHVEAHNEGTKPVANAYAKAKSGAIAVETTETPEQPLPAIAEVSTNDTTPTDGLSTSVAVAGSESIATAHAEGGDAPTAYATAGSDMYALAVGGKKPVVETFIDSPDSIDKSGKTKGQTWSISYVAGGQYTVAIATKHSAKAYASTYGAGTAFTADDVWAAAMTWASAYAEANRTTAHAWANAGAFGASGTSSGMSMAAAGSSGSASIRIELVHHVGQSSSAVAMQCSMKVTDWGFLNTVRPDERYRYMSCSCPQGWDNAPGIDRYCVRAATGEKVDAKVKAKTLGAVATKKKTSVARASTAKAVKNVAIGANQPMPITSLLGTDVAQN
jgi:hypothetical protein